MFVGITIWSFWLRCAAASLHYQLLTPEYSRSVENVNRDLSKASSSSRDVFVQDTILDTSCPPPQLLNIDGFCYTPDITQKFFVYGTPDRYKLPLEPKVPRPKIEYNVVVIKSSDSNIDEEPIVVPPPQQKTVVLVLKKESEKGKRKVIEIDSPNDDPEVFFVNYKEGENPDLPGGIDLKTALEASVNQNAKVVTRSSGQNELLGYVENLPYELLTTSSEYRGTFKRPLPGKTQGKFFRHDSTFPGTHLDLFHPELLRKSSPSQTSDNSFDTLKIDARRMLSKEKHLKRFDIGEKTDPAERQVSEGKKPPHQEKKPMAQHFKKGLLTVKEENPVTLKNDSSKKWTPFVPSSRVYLGKRTPAPGQWKRLTPGIKASKPSQPRKHSTRNKVQKVQYSSYYRLSPSSA